MKLHPVLLCALLLAAGAAQANRAPAGAAAPIELHDRLAPVPGAQPVAALTLDACGGGYDAGLIGFLIEHHIPATVFATKKWLDRNPQGIAQLLAHPELFDIEDHGTNHVPAVLGAGRRVYGIAGVGTLAALNREVQGGAEAIARITGRAPQWYRGATAQYDPQALAAIEQLGYRVAGFSVNADAGATLPKPQVIARLAAVRDGDVIIAHMNKPASQTAEGLSVGLARLQAAGFRFITLRDARLAAVR